MARSLQDDLPPRMVQDEPLIHTGATCPHDSTLVTLSGPRGAKVLQGQCPSCKRRIFGSAFVTLQTGTETNANESDLEAPKDDDSAKHPG